MVKKSKAARVMDLLNNAPGMTDKQVAAKVKCHPNYVWMLRKKMAHIEPCPEGPQPGEFVEVLELTPDMELPRLSGGSNDYYKLHVTSPTSGGDPYIAECNDIIEGLGMNYAEGNAFKAVWRRAALRNGGGKPGSTVLYESEKVEFFGKRLVDQVRGV